MPDSLCGKILNVDYNDAARRKVTRILQTGGFLVEEASTGKEALRQAARGPDLIVLDVDLPDIDGFEISRRIRTNPLTTRIPVLHLSQTLRDRRASVEALNHGADACLPEPVDADELLATVNALLRARRAEEALRRSEQGLRLAEQAAGVAAFEWDSASDLLTWLHPSPMTDALNIHSYSDWVDRLHPDDRERALREFTAAMERKGRYRVESRLITGEDSRWFLTLGEFIQSSSGAVTGARGLVVDITSRKLMEQAIVHAEERFRLLVEGVKDYAIFMLDPTGRVISWNSGIQAIKGYTEEEVVGRHFSCFYIPEDIKQGKPEWILRAAAEQGRVEDEGWRVRKDGSRFWADVVVTALRDDMGRLRGFGKVTRDVTERRKVQSELELHGSQARLAGIVGSAMDAIITLDEQQCIVLFNASAEKIFGCRASDVIGTPIDRFIPQAQRAAHREHIRRFGSTGVTTRSMSSPGTLYAVRASGEEFPIEATISQVETNGQKLFTVILRDITERKKAEGELLRNQQALMQAEKAIASGQMASTLAHEINNPLSIVTNSLFLLHGNADLGDARYFLECAEDALQRINRITHQIFGLYGPAGKIEELSVTEVVDDAVSLWSSIAQARKVTVETRYESSARVHGNRMELGSMFAGLVANAIEACGEGGRVVVHVSGSTNWHKPGRQRVRIVVADTGGGIAPEHRNQIFGPFYSTKPEKGRGLGLWITRAAVHKHEGLIRMRSSTQAGRSGTVFAVLLPAAADPAASSN